ncbi:hypothetical protein [Oceanirhabdus sp. W0125-5]|uniref:hypothetical protein n=1 Tax=Oceanirhabdus sp. W0125-5 TaxID=2999116 RepID=UPI0022F2B0BF|nr:hypothetical protein [Oceanirhabdus sp. W0125-5]WBW97589.1 hypothetical protein OW730_01935 [Oceanirhabdus sp. W0125-5]
MIGYSCYECGVAVPKEHFTAENGVILCEECSQGVKPCSDRKKFLITDLTEGYFYFYKHDLFIKSRITGLNPLGEGLELKFENGEVNIWGNTSVQAIRRPSNIICEFYWCFIVKNTYGDIIGYVGKPKED